MIDLGSTLAWEQVGQEMHDLMAELYPICRSITGEGVRQSLAIVGRHIPLQIEEVASGTAVFDWTVPNEWNIRDAYVKNAAGEKVIDFQQSSLHVLNYSIPIQRHVALGELKEHLYSLPEYPDWIPYRTSYYRENWGFCLSDRVLQSLTEEKYEVFIDATLAPGHLTYAEYYLPGQSEEEIFPATAATPRWQTITCREWSWRPFWPKHCKRSPDDIVTAFCLSRAR